MRRTILTLLATVFGIVLMLGLKSLEHVAVTTSAEPSAPSTAGVQTPATTVSGTYTGDAVQTRYGTVQVEITVTDGQITAVDALQAPSGNPRNEQITSHAVPILTDEVLAAQNANVDSVSGASYTSDGYLQSLQSALDQMNG